MMQKQFESIIYSSTKAVPSRAALAISGGCDSIALLYLAHHWAKSHNIDLVILHVDHQLRSESKKDADFVEQHAQKLGYDFHYLEWLRDKQISSRVQEKAREARYRLMTAKCQELEINLLLTAHHQDDLLETYLMRLERGSGVLGLSYSNSYFVDNIHVVRPMLDFSKSEIQQYLAENAISWVEDESNNSDKYERNRIRKHIAKLTSIEKNALLEQMLGANHTAKILNEQLIQFIAEHVHINKMGFLLLDIKSFLDLEIDLQIQVISYILTVISGKMSLPRFRNVSSIIAKLQARQRIENSLHGCLLRSHYGEKLLVCREISDISANILALEDGMIWDNRFQIKLSHCADNLTISKLTLDDYLQIKDKLNFVELKRYLNSDHKLILFGMPVMKSLEKIVLIPHIYNDITSGSQFEFDLIFRPGFISRFTHFL